MEKLRQHGSKFKSLELQLVVKVPQMVVKVRRQVRREQSRVPPTAALCRKGLEAPQHPAGSGSLEPVLQRVFYP